MNLTSLLIIFGQIATWVTIVLVYFTLREMRNQRKAAQKPDLILPMSTVYGYAYGYDGIDFLIARLWRNDKEVKDVEYNWSQSTIIKIYNVGFGVAKNIELKWTVDYDRTIQEIKDYCYQNSIPIIIQIDKNVLTVIEGDVAPDIHYPLSIQTFNHDFLMPASITSEGLGSYIPAALKELISISIYLKSHHSKNVKNIYAMDELEINFPSVNLELSYDDLENSHYSKKFNVALSVAGFTTVGDEKAVRGLMQLFDGSFEFKILP